MSAAGISFHRSRRERPLCLASGWGLNTGCTDGHGHCLCPHCSRLVDVEPVARHVVRVARHPDVTHNRETAS